MYNIARQFLSSCKNNAAARWIASEATTTSMASTANQSISVGPSVRLLLNLYRIEPSLVTATGPHGRLLKGDVLSYINSKGLDPKPYPTEEIINVASPPVSPPASLPSTQSSMKQDFLQDSEAPIDIDISSMRKTIAKRLTLSKSSIPHNYIRVDCNVQSLLSLRRMLVKEDAKVSVNDFIVKACASALKEMPLINSSLVNETVQPLTSVDVAVAVATENGLITPIVKNADEKSVQEISNNIKELASRAREGKLMPQEFQGGSFTISNLGMFGIKEFTAVINPPQSCILAVGSTQVNLSEDGKPVQVVTITLSSDSRVVNDIESAEFLSIVKNYLENPTRLV